jgi:hypothetical protein
MTHIKAMTLALEEFKHIKQWCLRSIGIGLVNENVLAALEEALAKQEQGEQWHKRQQALDEKAKNACELGLDYEPENTLHWHALNYRTAPTQNAQAMFEALEKFVAKQEQGEPVGKVVDCNELGYPIVHFGQALFIGTLLYTTPQQRKPLTDAQIEKLLDAVIADKKTKDQIGDFARAIEAAHEIKE